MTLGQAALAARLHRERPPPISHVFPALLLLLLLLLLLFLAAVEGSRPPAPAQKATALFMTSIGSSPACLSSHNASPCTYRYHPYDTRHYSPVARLYIAKQS